VGVAPLENAKLAPAGVQGNLGGVYGVAWHQVTFAVGVAVGRIGGGCRRERLPIGLFALACL